MNQRKTYRRRFLMFPVFALAAALLLGGAVMWLWNAIIPSVFNVTPLKYWQAVGLLALCRLLFGNFGGRMSGPSRWNRNWRDVEGNTDNDKPFFGGPPWRGKWMNMTDEERKQFRDEMKRRCGRRPDNG